MGKQLDIDLKMKKIEMDHQEEKMVTGLHNFLVQILKTNNSATIILHANVIFINAVNRKV